MNLLSFFSFIFVLDCLIDLIEILFKIYTSRSIFIDVSTLGVGFWFII